jgi:RNA polymerase sigma-70 factor (ECF subfamily)
MKDEYLINNLKKGDLHVFKVLVDEHQKRVLNTCYRFVNNREDAEDLTQEVFLEVYKSISRFRGDSKLSTWIYRIAMTKSLDFLRKQKRKKRFGIMKNIFSDPTQGKEISGPNDEDPAKKTEAGDRITILN